MIEPVFVDSFAWIAAINKSDNYHEISLRILEELLNKQAKLITTNYVVVETITGDLFWLQQYWSFFLRRCGF
ncbi:MAG: hypothetical protein LWX52_07410 [Deltaproteobacteria bacterium]|jgi:predicted nucleic acid-binding protein|nr:hypothetical protein [Deltaproteobacteria bacterium]